uniref:Uncharacterized protein n=1 Tax=Timema tahoe TaxID=61484 RepID=A0A7R9NVI7_9NEOP|nr:unnamed protein product [Timema tahoe]
METCDISLVKEEIIELIKTEPQNENEFDLCGQSGIKTESSPETRVEEIEPSIREPYPSELAPKPNREGLTSPKAFREENHSPFIPRIESHEKDNSPESHPPQRVEISPEDETETSNSVREIVKTEIKLYDSSLGIMDSNIDHFAPVDISEVDKFCDRKKKIELEILMNLDVS